MGYPCTCKVSMGQALPAEVKTALERPDACYAFGYSIGREVMENEQTEDLKMSFYNNPVSEAGDVDPEMMKQHPNFVGLALQAATCVLPCAAAFKAYCLLVLSSDLHSAHS